MTIQFHRLTVPTYAGGLPVNYDYINNATSGTPASVSGVLMGGPNSGSYLVGFGDDGTSANVNRPAVALAANTDYLDNLLHRDIALPVVSSTSAGGAGALNIVLPTATFLGVGGTTNNPSGLKPYFHVTDDSDNDIVDAAGNPVVVASLTLTSPDAIGVGFSVNTVTAVFSEAIPTGRNYRVYYSTRGNLASLPQDAFTVIRIRGAQEVPEQTELLFQTLHGNNLAWDAPWTTTIWDLARSGLDERYNRAVVSDGAAPSGWPVSIANAIAGSGAWFKRTGPGITGFSNWSTGAHTGLLSQEIWMGGALFAALNQDTGAVVSSAAQQTRFGGDTTGFFFLGHQRYTNSVTESAIGAGPGFASFFYGSAVETTGTPNTNFATWIPPGATITFDGTDGSLVTLGTGWFSKAGTPMTTAIAIGYDLIEVDVGDGTKRQMVVTSIVDPTHAHVAMRDGSYPNAASTVLTVSRWIRTTMGMFENAPLFRDLIFGNDGGVSHQGFMVMAPPQLSTSGGEQGTPPITASFFGPDKLSATAVLQWGGYDKTTGTYTYQANGTLFADGSASFDGTINSSGTGSNTFHGPVVISGTGSFLQVSNNHAVATSFRSPIAVSTGGTSPIGLNLLVAGALSVITPSGSGVLTVNVTNCVANSMEFSFSVHQTASNFTSVAVTCDAGISVHFESGTADSTLSTATATDLYRGKIIGTHCYMSVQRFPGV